jgi:crotonobetainyl-CoA:carnitine CoA-transferase CaiB-like acyl-CoA transferase
VSDHGSEHAATAATTTSTPAGARGPLAGVTVIDLSWHLAGPYCTLILADLGATVIKVEAPGSHGGYDPGGFIRHHYKGQDAHYMALNRNKQSITLNLKSAEGQEIMSRLLGKADVLFNNFRAGVMDRLGLGYEAVKAINGSIVYVSLSAFGQDGPYRDRPGVDVVVQAISGGMSMTGMPGGPPVRAGIPIADIGGGMWAAIAIISALRGRDAGLIESTNLDLSLLDGQIAMIPYFSMYYFLDGSVPGPQGSGGHSPTYGAFECSDGRHVVIAVIDQKPWLKLCQALRHEEWSTDPRFETATIRAENQETLHALLGDVFSSRSSEEWLDRLREVGLAAGRVNRLDEALSDPQVAHRKMVTEIDHSLGGGLRFVDTAVHFNGFEGKSFSPPLIGEHTQQVLGELGISSADYERLRAEGIV